jgi:hypothetical protein
MAASMWDNGTQHSAWKSKILSAKRQCEELIILNNETAWRNEPVFY